MEIGSGLTTTTAKWHQDSFFSAGVSGHHNNVELSTHIIVLFLNRFFLLPPLWPKTHIYCKTLDKRGNPLLDPHLHTPSVCNGTSLNRKGAARNAQCKAIVQQSRLLKSGKHSPRIEGKTHNTDTLLRPGTSLEPKKQGKDIPLCKEGVLRCSLVRT